MSDRDVFEELVRDRFKHIIGGAGSLVPRIAVKIALDDIVAKGDIEAMTKHYQKNPFLQLAIEEHRKLMVKQIKEMEKKAINKWWG